MINRFLSNEEIADKLDELAFFLELEGENPHKIRAYRNASRVIRGIGVNLCELVWELKDLKEFSGIGKNIEKKIIEIVHTGSLEKLEKLKQKYPPNLTQLLNIPGLGVKKIVLLFKEKKVSSLEDLLSLAKQGKLRDIPGFGEKTEKKDCIFFRGIL